VPRYEANCEPLATPLTLNHLAAAMSVLRYLSQLAMSLLFALGAANALLQGLLSGSFSGRKGATFPLHGSPVWFGVIACFFAAVTLCFSYLAYCTFLAGPDGVQRDADALQESRDRQRRRQKAALKSSRVPYVSKRPAKSS